MIYPSSHTDRRYPSYRIKIYHTHVPPTAHTFRPPCPLCLPHPRSPLSLPQSTLSAFPLTIHALPIRRILYTLLFVFVRHDTSECSVTRTQLTNGVQLTQLSTDHVAHHFFPAIPFCESSLSASLRPSCISFPFSFFLFPFSFFRSLLGAYLMLTSIHPYLFDTIQYDAMRYNNTNTTNTTQTTSPKQPPPSGPSSGSITRTTARCVLLPIPITFPPHSYCIPSLATHL